MRLPRFARDWLLDESDLLFRDFLAPLAPYLRRLGVGVAVTVASAALIVTGFLFLLASFFLLLTGYADLAQAAFVSGCLAWGVGAFTVWVGFQFLRPPRR